jgi:hypothetical protein
MNPNPVSSRQRQHRAGGESTTLATRSSRVSIFLLGQWGLRLAPPRAANEKGDWPWNLKLQGWHDRAEDLFE